MLEVPEYKSIRAKVLMNRVQHMPFRWSINPYRGCSHGCSFCYARPTHSFLGLPADDTFRSEIMVKTNAAAALEEQLEKILRRHQWNIESMLQEVDSVAIGTATDPYQPVEGRAKLTRACLEVLARYDIPVSITTRSPLVLRDIDLLKRMNTQSINISLNTLNPQIWRGLEPASPPPAARLEALAELRRHGITAGIFLAPIIPNLTDSTKDVSLVLGAARNHDAAFVMPSMLRLSNEVKAWFFAWIHEQFPSTESALRRLYLGQVPPRAYTEWKMGRIRLLMSRMGLSETASEASRSMPGSDSNKGTNESLLSLRQLMLPI